jgi:cyclase
MLEVRVIPCLQLVGATLVKTVKFARPSYIGDPANTVRIFNELEVDELCVLDVRATIESRSPNLKILRELAEEAFMPLSYGGGIRDLELVKEILNIGFEKVVVNSFAYEDPAFISRLADQVGSQAVIGSIDVRQGFLGRSHAYSDSGTKKTGRDPVEWAKRLQELGAGEILLTSVDRDGTWSGFDIELTRRVSTAVSVPVIANGGAGAIEDIGTVVREGGASAVALGSMVVFQSKGMGVLVSFPDGSELERELQRR